ncbi:MAG: glycosyltransferase family 39 protein [Frankiaceae bacterium]|nr:glycosyltransferase family 39 protein [Arenimonas sp.]
MSPVVALDPTQRRQLFWLFGLALLVLAAGYGLRDPWPADEPRFVLVAKQMFEGGSWWFPHRGSELYPDKPPLFFWLLAGARALIGSWRWSFLLPSLLSGIGTLWLTYDLGRRLWNHRAGLWSAIAVLSCLQFAYQFKRAQIDPTLVLFTTLAMVGLLRHLLLGPNWRWFWIGCFSAGVGVVLKGVGFLPLLMLIPYAVMRRQQWQGLAPLGRGNGWRWSTGALLFLAAIAAWLVPMVLMALASGDPEHRAYLDNLLYKQTATRYADAWHHHKPFWYFAEVIALFWLPFSLALAWLWRDWREAWQQRDARVWLPLAWAVLVLLFFSASPGKRDMYILPALPAVALVAGPYLPKLMQARNFQRALLALCIALATLLLGLGIAALVKPPAFIQKLIVDRGLEGGAQALWWMLVGVGASALAVAAWQRRAGAGIAMGWVLVALWCGYGWVAHPVLDPSSSARALMQRARDIAGPGVGIGLVEWKEQNLLQAIGPVQDFGYRRPAPEQLRMAVAWLDADPRHRLVLFSQPRSQVPCFSAADLGTPAVRSVGSANRRNWYLVARAGITPQCFGAGLSDPD